MGHVSDTFIFTVSLPWVVVLLICLLDGTHKDEVHNGKNSSFDLKVKKIFYEKRSDRNERFRVLYTSKYLC